MAWGQALKLAGRGALRSMGDDVGKQLVRQSIPGAVLNAGATTLFTGNPLLGLASCLRQLSLHGLSRKLGHFFL